MHFYQHDGSGGDCPMGEELADRGRGGLRPARAGRALPRPLAPGGRLGGARGKAPPLEHTVETLCEPRAGECACEDADPGGDAAAGDAVKASISKAGTRGRTRGVIGRRVRNMSYS